MPVLHLLYRKEITYTLQPRFSRLTIGVLMFNALIQSNNTILMMVLEAVM